MGRACDTHQLHLIEMMGFAGSTHPTGYNIIRVSVGRSPALSYSSRVAGMADHDPPYRPASRPPYELSVTRSDILTGRLVHLSEHSLRVAYCHYAVYPTASGSNPALVAFRDWVVEEASRS
jgi:hypothetical protein